METVGSADDLLNWIEYLSLPAGGWEGEGVPDIDPFEQPETASLNLSPFIATN